MLTTEQMEKLIEIIQKLKTDQYAAITVLNNANPLKKVVREFTGAMLIEKYGSIENFFEQVNKDGIKDITILVRRKNGGTYKADPKYNPINISFEPKAEVQTVSNQNNNAMQPQNWLTGGLNQADAIYKMMDHTRLVTECESMKAKNEILEKDNKELREKVLRSEITGTNSAANTELIKTLAPLMMPFVNKLVAAPDVAALNQPNISPVKQNFITAMQNVPDENIDFLMSIMAHFGNENYVKELDQLISKYNGGS